jgi:hypothetical protein
MRQSLMCLHTTSALDHQFHETVSNVSTHNFRIGLSVPWDSLQCVFTLLPHWTVCSMRRSLVWLHTTSALNHQFHENVLIVTTHNLCTRQFHEKVCTVTIHTLCAAQSVSGLVIQCGCRLNYEFRDVVSVLLLDKTGQQRLLLSTARKQTLIQGNIPEIRRSRTSHFAEPNWLLFINSANINNEIRSPNDAVERVAILLRIREVSGSCLCFYPTGFCGFP